MSLGSVVNAEQETAAALAGLYQQAEQAVQAAPVKNADETGWDLAGRLCWLWLAVTKQTACFKICAGRGRAALRQLLGDGPQGVVSSDRWSAYGFSVGPATILLGTLKRDFQKWVDWGGETAGSGRPGWRRSKQIFGVWRDFRPERLNLAGLRAALAPVVSPCRGPWRRGFPARCRKRRGSAGTSWRSTGRCGLSHA